MEPDPRVAAELAYQRALAALHDARDELAAVAAARHRLSFERVRLNPREARERQLELDSRHGALSGQVEQLREAAARWREHVRRLGSEVGAEPDEVPDGPASDGFEQPPYAEPGR